MEIWNDGFIYCYILPFININMYKYDYAYTLKRRHQSLNLKYKYVCIYIYSLIISFICFDNKIKVIISEFTQKKKLSGRSNFFKI